MTHVFKELQAKAETIFQQVTAEDYVSLDQSCPSLKDEFLGHVDGIKKLIASWVANKKRQKARALRYEVKDARVALERSIRSRYLVNEAELANARDALIVVAKKLIKIERVLGFADDMLFAGEISADMNEAVDQAKSAVADAEKAAEAMLQASKVKRLDDDHDESRKMRLN
jgi:outer membrane PBP1 activator LpoA protein